MFLSSDFVLCSKCVGVEMTLDLAKCRIVRDHLETKLGAYKLTFGMLNDLSGLQLVDMKYLKFKGR